jgi:3-oxoacyl-[acyl-carrier-protein] synthase-3
MSKLHSCAITAVSGWVPKEKLTNNDLSSIVDTSDEWITTRTGIKERRILRDAEKATAYMSSQAIKRLLKKRKIKASEIDLVICATVTPDMLFPSTAAIIIEEIGADNAFGFDLSAACSGFLFALKTGSSYVESGACKKVIIVGADKMSSIVDYTDRQTCVIFGDGAGAVLLEPAKSQFGILDTILKVDGSGQKYLKQIAGGSLNPATNKTVKNKEHFIYQDGKTVFKFAVSKMADVAAQIMKKNNLESQDISWLVPHQANLRIIDATARRMGIDNKKIMINIQKYGNTTAATIPLCLWEWEKKMKRGDNIILAAFGGGFTWGAVYLKWAYNS